MGFVAVVVVALLTSPLIWQLIEVQTKQDQLRAEIEESQRTLDALREDVVADEIRLRAMQVDQEYIGIQVERISDVLTDPSEPVAPARILRDPPPRARVK